MDVFLIMLALVCLFSAQPAEVLAACPSGWDSYHSSCYRFNINHTLSWNDALKSCSYMDAHLLVVETQAETDFLASKLTSLFSPADMHHDSASSTWIAGTDVENEGYWKWAGINQLIIQYTNWAPGEPDTGDGGHEEDCISMVGRRQFQWQDRRCTEKHAYVCETESGSQSVG